MKTISLYTNNGSWLTQLHPFTKLWYLAAAICIPLLTGSLWGFAVMIIISFVLLKSGRLIKKALPLIAFSFTIILTIFLIHGLVNQQNKNVLFAIGFLRFYKEGLLYAAHIGLNILNMLLSFAIVVLSTRPSELVDELERKGFSPRFGYIINSVFQIIPQMMGTMHTITDAQRSRGMETEGNLLVRIKAFLPLISPVVMSALTATRERAIALDASPSEDKSRPDLQLAVYCRVDSGTGREDLFMAFLEVEHLKYRYPHTKKLALDDISFTAEKGEFIGIIGENGAGKSTLSQAFCGLVPQFYKGAYGGKVTVDGIVAATTPTAELCKKVGLIFQNPFNQLSGAKDTVWDEVAFGLENFGVPAEQIHERLDKVLHQLDIWQFREKNPFDLSGGQMQRVAIASVLAMEPEILLLDEPTSQLDPQGSEEVFHTVELLTQTGITIFMIEQKMEKLASYCDKILLLHEGKQVAFDTPEKIFSRPDLAELGICPPYVTRYCVEQHLFRPDGTYPVVVEDVKEALKRDKERKVTLPQLADTVLAEAPENRFDVRNLKFSYTEDHPIFENFQLSLDQRPTAIIGQNGAGKTTLVRLLKGLLKPSAGTILYQGEDISRRTVASLAGQVGYVFQNPDDQIFKYKVIDEVMFGPLNIGMPKEKAMEKAMEALALTELTPYAGENPYDLELSQRKLVAIASVLAMDTDVIILDEPTIAQDYSGKEIIRNIIASLSEQGKLVLAILHDMDFVAQCFSRVVVLAHGQLLADGTPSEVFVQEDVLKKAALDMPHPLQLRKALEQIQ